MAAALCYGSRGGGASLAFHHQVGAYNPQTLIGALDQLRRFLGGQKATLLWDGLPAHRSLAMAAWLRRQRSWLVVERLPAYAPELNPVALWSSLKGVELANLAGDTLQDVIEVSVMPLSRGDSVEPAAQTDQRAGGAEDVPDPVQQPAPAAQRPGIGQMRDRLLHQRAQPRLQAIVSPLLGAEPVDGAPVPDRGVPVLVLLGHASEPAVQQAWDLDLVEHPFKPCQRQQFVLVAVARPAPSSHSRSPWMVETATPWAVWLWRLQSYRTFWLAHPRGRCTRVARPSTTTASPDAAISTSSARRSSRLVMKLPSGWQHPSAPSSPSSRSRLSPTSVLEMSTILAARRYDSPSNSTAATASRRTSNDSGGVPPCPDGRGGTRWARRAASQASTAAGSDERGQYDNGDQTSQAGFENPPMVWSRQRPDARSIRGTLTWICCPSGSHSWPTDMWSTRSRIISRLASSDRFGHLVCCDSDR
jgi:DDE superfamily endonuclease